MTSSVKHSNSMDALSSVDYEMDQIDYADLRRRIEDRFNTLLKFEVMCIDLLHNQAMKSKIITVFIESEGLSYVKHGSLVASMFENIWRCDARRIPNHTHVDLEHWMQTGKVLKLNDEEYLRQSLMLNRC